MKLILLGQEFFINNLGCEALSYSFVGEMYALAKEKGVELDIATVVFRAKKTPYIPGTDKPIRCIEIRYKSLEFWKKLKKEFKECDLIVDFTMGDSFSDIYGAKRFMLDALVKTRAVKSKTPFVLGPQTYGPYKNGMIRRWAAWIMKKAAEVYARDAKSQEVASALSKREVKLTTDIAFALPYKKVEVEQNGKTKVGFNPSGLLWIGGYTHDNQFGLTIDYQEYCYKVMEYLHHAGNYEVYLVPHVGTSPQKAKFENDYSVCQLIQEKYPEMKILSDINTPMDIKGYLAAMDVFIGARMHATIGAFSSGVATIPVSYSRKFEGLYDSLDYDYVIHALQYNTEEAVQKTIEYLEDYQVLQEKVEKSMLLVQKKQQSFRDSMKQWI